LEPRASQAEKGEALAPETLNLDGKVSVLALRVKGGAFLIDSRLGGNMRHRRELPITKCLLAGVLIETPLFLWFLIINFRGTGYTRQYLVLSFLHLPGLAATGALLASFGPRLSRPVFEAVQFGGMFVVQCGVFAVVVYEIAILRRRWRLGVGMAGRAAEPSGSLTPGREQTELRNLRALLILSSIMIGAGVEAPLFIGLRIALYQLDLKVYLLGIFHLPGLLVGLAVTAPFKSLFSWRTLDSISWCIAFITQSCLISIVVFRILRWWAKRGQAPK
jgi:hypothetical protein